MKKLISFVLIAILLLNVMGYYGVFLGLQYRNNVAMLNDINTEDYDESQTVSIKIPLAVPYMQSNTEFERVDGLFEHEGEFYRLVKQKYAQDTLTVICIKDTGNKRIQQALTHYVKSFTDKSSGGHHPSPTKLTITFIKDYIPQAFSLKSLSSGWHYNIVHDQYTHHLVPSFEASIVHPPERG